MPGALDRAGATPFGQALKHNADEFVRAMEAFAARGGSPTLVCFCPSSRLASRDSSKSQALAETETALAEALGNISGVHVASTAELSARYPVADYDDPAGEELGHIPYTPVFFTALATWIARKFHALRHSGAKVIALDCDQTLWAGVCGEDGPTGIQIDRPRLALQRFMRRQQESGKLLVICSKNDEADVEAVFSQGTAMPLTREHFSGWRVNWQPKSENLKSLAKELNLGLDSFILIDDNPVECAEVESNCPAVLTLQLPEDPALIPQFLDHCWAFDQLKATTEDKSRVAMYTQNRLREQTQAQSMSFADFIASLKLEIQIAPATEGQWARLAQLTLRTNQFNVSGRRRAENELRQMNKHCQVFAVSVKDRFGDYGLVGAMIFEVRDQILTVDSFLLSCRALGRGVEHQMLATLGEMARQRGALWVDVPFERLPRNQPALEFLESVGAPFKQPHQFHFPTDVAANVVFDPHRAAPQPQPKTGKDASPSTGPPRKFTQCRAIALESCEVAKIHQRIEARLGLRSTAKTSYSPPRTQMERQLCDLWRKMLRVERVGLADDFFELGGHSLLAVRLFGELEKMTGRKLPLVTIFQAPTVGQLASVIARAQASDSDSALVPIQPRGSKPPLYLIHGAGGDVLWGYANLVAMRTPISPSTPSNRAGKLDWRNLTGWRTWRHSICKRCARISRKVHISLAAIVSEATSPMKWHGNCRRWAERSRSLP